MSQATPHVCFGFGEFELDPAVFELRRAGQRVALQPKVLGLLCYLIEQRERVVPQDELLRVLWPGETVGANSVRRAVTNARRALGDSGDSQASIQTLPRLGYRFVRPIHVIEHNPVVRETDGAHQLRTESSQPEPKGTGPLDDMFVGRAATLRLLDARLEQALRGSGGLLLLSGEPGIGKTRTVQELARRAQQLGADAWLGRCLEEEGAPAFWPWLQIMRQCVQARGAAYVRQLLGPSAAEIVHALPELRAVCGDLAPAPPIDDAHARFRFFDSIAQFFIRAAAERPLALIFDDLQRADQPSLRLLAFLAAQLNGSRILLTGTYRTLLERDADAGPARWFNELQHSDTSLSIALSGMQRDEVAQYLALAAQRRAPDEIADIVYERTGGNPLFLRQLVHSWLAAGQPDAWRWFDGAARDHNLREAIARWLGSLSEPCRSLLCVAAVIGRDFSVATLARACDLQPSLAVERLGEAVRAGVIRPLADLVGRYRYVHVLLRDALYEQLSQTERGRAHARVGAALEAQLVRPHAGEIAELAYHFVAAAPAFDTARALSYACRAARCALDSFAYEQAAAHFDQALQVLELDAPEPAARMELLLQKGEALASADQIAAARRALDQAVGIARGLGSLDALVRAARAMSMPVEATDVDTEHVTLLEEVLGLLPDGDLRRPVLQALLAKALTFSGEHARRAAIAHEAVRGARAFDDAAVLADTLRHCLPALSEPEDYASRRALTDQLIELARSRNDQPLLLHAYFVQLHNHLEVGELASVDAVIPTMQSLATRARQPYFRWIAATACAMRAIVAGEFAAAEELAMRALALGQRFHEPTADAIYSMQMSAVWRLQGQLGKARDLVRTISARYPTVTGWRAVLAYLEAQNGHIDLARQEFQRLFDDDLRSARRDSFVMSTLAPLADLGALVGDTSAARVLYDALLPYAAYQGVVPAGAFTHGPMARQLGLLAARMKRFDLAQTHFESALEQSERMPSPPYVCLTCQGYALMLAKRAAPGDLPCAGLLLTRALNVSEAQRMQQLSLYSRAIAERYGLCLRQSMPVRDGVASAEPR